MDHKEIEEMSEKLVKSIQEQVAVLERTRETIRAMVPVSNHEAYTRLVALIVDECFDYLTGGLGVEMVVEAKDRLIEDWLIDLGYTKVETRLKTVIRMGRR